MIWYIIGGIVLLCVLFVAFLNIRDALKEKRVRRDGTPVLASLVMANQTLLDPEGDPLLPGVVVFSFESPTPKLRNNLQKIGEAVYELYEAEDLREYSKVERRVSQLIKDHNYQEARRNMLPKDITGDRVVYLADLWINRDYMPRGWERTRALACKVTGENEGEIVLLGPEETEAQEIYDRVFDT